MQNSSLDTIIVFSQPDSSYEKHAAKEIYNFNGDTDQVHKCFIFLLHFNVSLDANKVLQKVQNLSLDNMIFFQHHSHMLHFMRRKL